MHAAVVQDFAAPPVCAEFPDPERQEGEVVAEVLAAAVPNLVRMIAAGRHCSSTATPPLVPGIDGVVRLPEDSLAYVVGVRPTGARSPSGSTSCSTSSGATSRRRCCRPSRSRRRTRPNASTG